MKKIKLMADYGCYPLWDASGDPVRVGDIDPDSLPISRNLKEDLMLWAADFDAILNMDDPASSGFKSPEDECNFKKRGIELADRLRKELSNHCIILF